MFDFEIKVFSSAKIYTLKAAQNVQGIKYQIQIRAICLKINVPGLTGLSVIRNHNSAELYSKFTYIQ